MRLALATLALAAWLAGAGRAAAAEDLAELAFQPHPGARLPLAAGLFDETGRAVTLSGFFGGEPVVLVLEYLRCKNLCGLSLQRIFAALAALLVFLGLKGVEYSQEYAERLVPGLNFDPAHGPVVELFYYLYFTATGLHALHLTIGVAVVAVIAMRAWRGAFSPAYYAPVEVTGLYWHFVDLVWIFLYPLIYLNGRSGG